MRPLSSSTLAPVSTGSGLLFYYQFEDKIFEATSQDGSSWKLNPDAVAKGLRSWGSPFTAYYNHQDADYSDKETIHILYIASDSKLVEQFRYLSETKWEIIPSNVIADNQPTETSRIIGGSVVGPHAIHRVKDQFVYYESQKAAALNVTEIWRTPKSPWYIQTVLPGKVDQQPGSDFASVIKSPYLHVFYQDHAGNIKLWENISGWHDNGIHVKAADVSRQAAIAAATTGPSAEDKDHIVFPGSGQGATIKHFVDNKISDTGVQFYPGSRLGLVGHGSKIILFYLDVHGGAAKTKIYDAGAWKDGVTVVQ